MIRKLTALLTFILIALLALGCASESNSNNENKSQNEAEDPSEREPVTLRMSANQYGEEEFNKFFKEPIENAYPHITLERDEAHVSAGSVEELILADELPDLIQTTSSSTPHLSETGIITDLEPFVEKDNFDLSNLRPEAYEQIFLYGELVDDVTIPWFPVSLDHNSMIYNKDIFDKFGVDYPEDGMTWDEVIELAKQLTQEEDGVQYKGLATMPVYVVASQLSSEYVDPETKEVLVDSEEWVKTFELLKEIHTIPGNEDAIGWPNIFEDQTIAMHPRVNVYEQVDIEADVVSSVDWDIVQYPSYADNPDVAARAPAHVVILSSMTDHPEDAFLAMTALLSHEAQQIASEHMTVPVVDDRELEEHFGKNFPAFADKNTDAIFKGSPAPLATPTLYNATAEGMMNDAFAEQVLEKGLDINTALRIAKEEVEEFVKDTQSRE